MADDYVRMGCAEVKKMTAACRQSQQRLPERRILVVGGGISGMTAALEASKAGYKVVLVEKTGALGGWAAKLYKRVPVTQPLRRSAGYRHRRPGCRRSRPTANIKVYLNSTISQDSGAPGQFRSTSPPNPARPPPKNVGAIIQASGFTLYDANKLPELGCGKSANVVDQAGLEALAKAANGGAIKRPSDGGEVKSVVFVQCAGQRDDTGKHLPYCSGSLLQHQHQAGDVLQGCQPGHRHRGDLHRPAHARQRRRFYRSAQNKGVIFTKGKVSSVEANGNTCKVKFKDLILERQTAIDNADLVVLATGQVPNSGVDIDAKLKAELLRSGDNACWKPTTRRRLKAKSSRFPSST